MNCEPGDLAYVARNGWQEHVSWQGVLREPCPRLMTVVRVTEHDGHLWRLAEPFVWRHRWACGCRYRVTIDMLHDDLLRPLRGDPLPGEEQPDDLDEVHLPEWLRLERTP